MTAMYEQIAALVLRIEALDAARTEAWSELKRLLDPTPAPVSSASQLDDDYPWQCEPPFPRLYGLSG